MARWMEQAEALFFVEHLNITDIAVIMKKSRKTVSNYLNSHENYENEMNWRKEQNRKQRKKYQRDWDRNNRSNYEAGKQVLKNCHNEAVRVLSYERYF